MPTSNALVKDGAFAFVMELAAALSAGTVDLPCAPEAAVRVRKALEDPNTSAEKIAQIIGAEPALATRLMSMANSAAFTITGKLLGDLRSAVVRLGSNVVRSAAIAFTVEQLCRQSALKAVEKPLRLLWADSTHIAAYCYVLAKRTRINPDEAFLAGLLHAMGKLYVLVRAADHTDLFVNSADLTDIVDGWHAAIGQAILKNWNLPESMVSAVSNQDDRSRKHYGEPDLTDVLICAKIVAASAAKPLQLATNMACVDAFRQLRLDPQICLELITQAKAQIDTLRSALGG